MMFEVYRRSENATTETDNCDIILAHYMLVTVLFYSVIVYHEVLCWRIGIDWATQQLLFVRPLREGGVDPLRSGKHDTVVNIYAIWQIQPELYLSNCIYSMFTTVLFKACQKNGAEHVSHRYLTVCSPGTRTRTIQCKVVESWHVLTLNSI